MQLTEFGDPPVFALNEVPDPEPGPTEVVVTVKAAALNRRDKWVWTSPGYCELPVTLGSDGAGVVSAVGGSVPNVSVGDEVVIFPTLGWEDGADLPTDDFDILGAPSDGTFAEKVRVSSASVHPRPSRLSWAESGALPLAGLTAYRALFTCGRITSGTRVLLTGAGSGVATFLLQLAVAAGADVAVTTGSSDKARRCLDLGARAAVLYTDDGWQEEVRRAMGHVDVVVDSYGAESFPTALPLLRRGGTFVSFGDTGGASTTFDVAEVYWQWRSILGTSMGGPHEFRALLAAVNSSSWVPVIDRVFRLEDLSAASERLSSPERFGKVVIEPSAKPARA